MDTSQIFMITGFLVASYSIVANDSIQTLGTFISSNKAKPWWFIWIFAATILTSALVFGWYINDGDVSYGRLKAIPHPGVIEWWHALPPIVLLLLTRKGIPVSTTFLVLSIFSSSAVLGKILLKSVSGYGIAFLSAVIIWMLISKKLEKRFLDKPSKSKLWVAAQWVSTGFLWQQWLIQDFANVFVYLPRKLEFSTLALSLGVMLFMLAIVMRSRGGQIQGIVSSKSNTGDIRSATLIDFTYALVLFFFKELNNLPMSTTWVFLGILAGREFAINHQLHMQKVSKVFKLTSLDLGKAALGLGVSLLITTGIAQVRFIDGASKQSRNIESSSVIEDSRADKTLGQDLSQLSIGSMDAVH